MENVENIQNAEIKRKIETFFENKLIRMEEKFISDYEILRGFSILYTEMYHDFQENIIPNSIKEDSKSNKKDNLDVTKSINQTPKRDRSRTPINSAKPTKKEEETKSLTTNKNIKSSTSNIKERDRSKTPITTKDKPNEDTKRVLKKDSNSSGLNKSTNNLPTIKNVKKNEALNKSTNNLTTLKNDDKIDMVHKTIENKPEKLIKKDKEVNPKNIKREMTPTPLSKKNALDISQDDSKSLNAKEIKQHSHKSSTKDVKEPKKMNLTKRGTVSTPFIKGDLEAIPINTSKRNTVTAIKKNVIDNSKIKTQISNEESLKKEEDEKNESENKEKTETSDTVSSKKQFKIDLSNRKPKIEFSNKYIECLSIVSNST
jgi:hypothetical protein